MTDVAAQPEVVSPAEVESPPDASPSEQETDARSIAVLQRVFADPRLEPLVGVLVDQALAESEDPLASMRGLVDDVARLGGDRDAATLFVTLLAYWDDEAYVASIVELLPDDEARRAFVADFGRLAARRGRQVRQRYDLSSRDPSDWQYIDVRTFYELQRGQWNLEVVIQNFAQREFKLYGPTLSYLRMVNRLLDPVVQVHEAGGADPHRELDEESISTFLDLSSRLIEVITAGMEGQEDAPAEDATDPEVAETPAGG